MALSKGYVYRNPFVNPDKDKGFRNEGKMITEQKGYITVADMLQDMQNSGRILQDYREGYYDFDEESDPGGAVPDPTRMPNFDLVDAQRISEQINKASRKRKEGLQRAAEEEKAKNMPEAPKGPQVESSGKAAKESEAKD